MKPTGWSNERCPWYKSCVTPMKFTAEDLRNNWNLPSGNTSSNDMSLQSLLSSMATAAQNSLLEACPIFIERLRASPKLAQRVKQIMQNWGNEE